MSGIFFVLRFLVAGAVVPLVLCSLAFIFTSAGLNQVPSPNGVLTEIVTTVMWVVWPTAYFMIDAEHLDVFLFVLPIAALMNGAWYSVIGLLIWWIRRLVQRVKA